MFPFINETRYINKKYFLYEYAMYIQNYLLVPADLDKNYHKLKKTL